MAKGNQPTAIAEKFQDFMRRHVVSVIAEENEIPRGYFYAFRNPKRTRLVLGERAFAVFATLIDEPTERVRADFIARGGQVARGRGKDA